MSLILLIYMIFINKSILFMFKKKISRNFLLFKQFITRFYRFNYLYK